MVNTEPAANVPPTDDEVRRHNRAIVENYMTTRGEDRLRRHLLFTEDGVGGLGPTTPASRSRSAAGTAWVSTASGRSSAFLTGSGPTSRYSTPRTRTGSGSSVTAKARSCSRATRSATTATTSCTLSCSRTGRSSSSANS